MEVIGKIRSVFIKKILKCIKFRDTVYFVGKDTGALYIHVGFKRSVVSQPVEVWDYMFYDDGVTGTTLPSNWDNYDWQITRDETGTKMLHNKSSGWCALKTTTFTFQDICVEFDMVDYSGNVYFQFATNNNTEIPYGRRLFPTAPVHFKIEVVGNTITTRMGTQVMTDDITSATKNTIRFQFANNVNCRYMKIKNFKMYPI